MHGVLAAVSMAAVMLGGSGYRLPCHSPNDLLAKDASDKADEVYERTLVTRSALTLGGPADLDPRLNRQWGPDDPQSDRNLKGFVMRRFGLAELESDRGSFYRMRFERARHLEFRVKVDMDRPGFGIAYVTRY